MEDVIKKFLLTGVEECCNTISAFDAGLYGNNGFGSGDGSGYGRGSGDGYDYGYGDGYGDGYGLGNGRGSGLGYGSGYGDGYGDGYGLGNGYGLGDGYGYGCGFGDGSGYGSGDGYGYGDGLSKYNGIQVHLIDGVPTLIYSVHGNYAKGATLDVDLTLTPCYIAKVEDCFAHGKTLHKAMEDARDKALENKTVEERIDMFLAEYPTPNEKHKGTEFFEWHHILTGSCEMGRKQFCKDNGIDIEQAYSPMEFLELCKEAYGGEVIKNVIERY